MKVCHPARLPFLGFYEELALSLLLERLSEADPVHCEAFRDTDDLLQAESKVESSSSFFTPAPPPAPTWGDDSTLIESWFDAGEVLAEEAQAALGRADSESHSPDRLERAWRWMRSFAAAAGLIAT